MIEFNKKKCSFQSRSADELKSDQQRTIDDSFHRSRSLPSLSECVDRTFLSVINERHSHRISDNFVFNVDLSQSNSLSQQILVNLFSPSKLETIESTELLSDRELQQSNLCNFIRSFELARSTIYFTATTFSSSSSNLTSLFDQIEFPDETRPVKSLSPSWVDMSLLRELTFKHCLLLT